MFAGADEVLHVVAPRIVPIGTKLPTSLKVELKGKVRLWLDSEVRMAKLSGPLVLWIGEEK